MSPRTCSICLETHIKTQLATKVFALTMITCAECPEPFTPEAINAYDDPSIAALFTTRTSQAKIEVLLNLFWCPAPGCGSAQIHASGDTEPIVRCGACIMRFCFRHRVPWHETLACAEYDAIIEKEAATRARHEAANLKTIARKTKPCPNARCRWPIEKNTG
ncbi:hypothetical protein BU23DRAFT_639463, partial [Bimuria novae-zelandiae CBS 107.79]